MIEGMLSGAIPVALDRPGVEDLIGRDWVRPDTPAAAEWMLGIGETGYGQQAIQAKRLARDRFYRGGAEVMWRDTLADAPR